MPLIKVTVVKLGKDERPEIDRSVLTDIEWDNLTQSMLRQKAQRSHAGKVFTLVGADTVRIVEMLIK